MGNPNSGEAYELSACSASPRPPYHHVTHDISSSRKWKPSAFYSSSLSHLPSTPLCFMRLSVNTQLITPHLCNAELAPKTLRDPSTIDRYSWKPVPCTVTRPRSTSSRASRAKELAPGLASRPLKVWRTVPTSTRGHFASSFFVVSFWASSNIGGQAPTFLRRLFSCIF